MSESHCWTEFRTIFIVVGLDAQAAKAAIEAALTGVKLGENDGVDEHVHGFRSQPLSYTF